MTDKIARELEPEPECLLLACWRNNVLLFWRLSCFVIFAVAPTVSCTPVLEMARNHFYHVRHVRRECFGTQSEPNTAWHGVSTVVPA